MNYFFNIFYRFDMFISMLIERFFLIFCSDVLLQVTVHIYFTHRDDDEGNRSKGQIY
jgi:hypothetical protein